MVFFFESGRAKVNQADIGVVQNPLLFGTLRLQVSSFGQPIA
jgi:hypothetical protein